MSKAIMEMAKKYYPALWSEQRVLALHAAGKLTDAELAEVLGTDQEESEVDDNGKHQ